MCGLESDAGGEDGVFARLAFEFLGPVPLGELSIEAKTVRPGRRVSLREATLSDGAGRQVMLCRAWRISASPVSLSDDLKSERPTLPGPEDGKEKPFFEMAPEVGYHRGIEARFVEGSWREPGHAAAWLRMRVPLLPGEEPSPLVRVLVAADSGNGVGGALDTSAWTFVNLETTVHLHAYPSGEWVGLESSAAVRSLGVGLARTTIHDPVKGRVGAAAQSCWSRSAEPDIAAHRPPKSRYASQTSRRDLFLVPLFTRVHGRVFLRTSDCRSSGKLARPRCNAYGRPWMRSVSKNLLQSRYDDADPGERQAGPQPALR